MAAGFLAWPGSSPLMAQAPIQFAPGVLSQVQIAQPPVDVSPPENFAATAAFDPPVVHVGEKFYYRATLDAVEAGIDWPENVAASPELKLSRAVHGQLNRFEGSKYRPLTGFTCEVIATATGQFRVPAFAIHINGRSVEIPPASVTVVETNVPTPAPGRKLLLEASDTNLFFGQPFRMRVILPAAPGNQLESAREIQFNGGSFMLDKTAIRQTAESINVNGQLKQVFTFEVPITPLTMGPMKMSAQGFTASIFSAAPISITSSGTPITLSGPSLPSAFLVSDELKLNVRPLPMDKALPGFTGALGKFVAEKPQLATNRLSVGEPVQLKAGFRAEGNLARFAKPEIPRLRDWQIVAEKTPGDYTLIPLTDEATNTPAIPFCAFDPATGQFYDLTIPPLPVTITGEGLPLQIADLSAVETNAAPLTLSRLAPSQGRTIASLTPLQLHGWFLVLQVLPMAGFVALWRWDARRRFLESRPDIVRRRRAKRDLRREQKVLRRAVAAGDPEKFLRHAVAAMRIAVAPHFPAEARAMVGVDVLSQLDKQDQDGRAGETVRKFCGVENGRFGAGQPSSENLLGWHSDLEALLAKLEAKL